MVNYDVNKILKISKKDRRRLRGYKPHGYISYHITLPKPWIELLGWEVGDELLLELQDDKIIIKRRATHGYQRI